MSTEINDNNTLILVLHEGYLAAWMHVIGQAAQPLRVQGDWCVYLDEHQPVALLHEALQDLAARLLDDEQSLPARVCWVADAAARDVLVQYMRQHPQPIPPNVPAHSWQILDWMWLAVYLRLSQEQIREPFAQRDESGRFVTLSDLVLPWIVFSYTSAQASNMGHEATKVAYQAAAQADSLVQELEKLRVEFAQVSRRNDELQAQARLSQRIDTERLLSFLPVLFQRPFNEIGEADLTLAAGQIEPIHIPSPYPEPAPETRAMLQNRFRALSRDQQLEIILLVKDLPQRQKLKPWPAMQELIQDLEQ